MSARRVISAVLLTAPVGWRTPQFQPIVLGTRTDKRGKLVPNVRVQTYPTATVAAFQSFAMPQLASARVDGAKSAGVLLADDESFLRGAIGFRLCAIHPRARSDHRVRTALSRERSTFKPDLTNVLKLTEDCCTRALWWRDDAQIAEQHSEAWTQSVAAHRCEKGVACPEEDEPRVQIVAWELEDEGGGK